MKQFLLGIVLGIFSLSVCAQTPQDTTAAAPMSRADSIVAYAKQHLGKPYKYAHAGPDAFDCSGFVSFVFAHFGIALPRSSRDYMHTGREIPIEQARKGDVIVFTGTNPRERRAGHVGIVISEPGAPLQFIHASSSDKHRGVVITQYPGSNYPKRFIKVIRVVE
ncbi:MAG: C40 family peptidase [Bacteroidetes bacterium]|nr:C40 family peptidase [Bacteroidota bacterium]